MAGFDQRDSTSAQRQDEWLTDLANGQLPTVANLRIGLPSEYYAQLAHGAPLEAVRQQLRRRSTNARTCLDVGDRTSDVFFAHCLDCACDRWFVSGRG